MAIPPRLPPTHAFSIRPNIQSGAAKQSTLLALSQAARRLGRSVVTLRRWHRAGFLPFVTINGRHYVEPGELAALVARHRQGGGA